MIVFRGSSAQVVLEPTRILDDAFTALEYLPTGGRTPLGAALAQAHLYLSDSTLLVLITDGRANVAFAGGDPWQEALKMAGQIRCSALVVDTENGGQGECSQLAEVMGARYMSLKEIMAAGDVLLVERNGRS